ncbi:1-aminocyclopropane-1-carboxylate synthase [Lojkania enalia]|uniref:1-aminocyclopropane-1-carboxylate synthase n=1 Tax=Lojkania enalia TaxID=147567 RepID=A0A9P4MYV5_9PLEO|nr:1-aminocyclopropane-1-carboxylate synthase [Didymosphaeria enalia]
MEEEIESYGLSPRGSANVSAVWPRIRAAVAEREKTASKPANSIPSIDLGTSENWLIRKELIALYKAAVNNNLEDRHLSYPNGFAGDQTLVESLAQFFNKYFKPWKEILKDHITTAPGAAYSLNALLYNICEAGDGLLVPVPCWNGFDWLLNVSAGVQPVFVPVPSFDDVFTDKLIPALENAFRESTKPIKGLLFTNPHNPFGKCYPRDIIKQIIKFCDQKKIHFISDELYALSRFEGEDLKEKVEFASALSVDVEGMECDASRVHVIWSTSKDLGSSGLRMGCCITQANRPLATGIALSTNTQVSSLTAVATTSLLTSPKLQDLLTLNSERLAMAYKRTTDFLKLHNIQYMPAYMGPFLFARVAPNAQTWEDEADVIAACKNAGVSLSAGKNYHLNEGDKGWARITFAVSEENLEEALKRLEVGLGFAGNVDGVDDEVGS